MEKVTRLGSRVSIIKYRDDSIMDRYVVDKNGVLHKKEELKLSLEEIVNGAIVEAKKLKKNSRMMKAAQYTVAAGVLMVMLQTKVYGAELGNVAELKTNVGEVGNVFMDLVQEIGSLIAAISAVAFIAKALSENNAKGIPSIIVTHGLGTASLYVAPIVFEIIKGIFNS